jgi:tripartite-type tricarboxylate transporter receptor subunit TctC
MPRHLPGSPTIIVENRVGAGGLLAANTTYNSEPKDGTVIAYLIEGNVLQQALGAPGVEFDAAQFQWLGSPVRTTGACLVRSDAATTSMAEVIAGKEVIIGGAAPGATTFDFPAVLKAALGANIKLVPGYDGPPRLLLAIEGKEIDGYCVSLLSLFSDARTLLEGENPRARVLVVLGSQTPDMPQLRGVPAAETLTQVEESKQMLRAINAPQQMNRPLALPPGVPNDRVQALRAALAQTFADPRFIEDMTRANQGLSPNTGEQVTRTVQELLSTPPATLAKLKDALK